MASPGFRLAPGLPLRMASLWQQWPTDCPGPDDDASGTAAANGADSPGGGCASTAETGASDAATQQPTEAEESPGEGVCNVM